jgi:hypothetical protein
MTTASGNLQTPSVNLQTADIRTLAISVVAAVATSVVVSKAADFIKLDTTLANAISETALGSTFAFYHILSRRRGVGLVPAGIVRFSGFELAWPVVTILGAFGIIAAGNAAAFVGGLLTGTIEGALGASVVAAVVASFAVGRWIGIRADQHALIATVITAYLARLLGAIIDMALTPADIRGALGMALTTDYAIALLVGGGIWAVSALCGGILGRRAREAGYLSYLLARIPAGTRTSVMELVYDESKRLQATDQPSNSAAPG